MSRWLKLLIGLLATLLVAWLSYGPLGQGAAFVDRLEADARNVVAQVKRDNNLPVVIAVRMSREPLSRVAVLSGTDNAYLRCGSASFIRDNGDCHVGPRDSDVPGFSQYVERIPGMGGVRWTPQGKVMPLLGELMIMFGLVYALGVGLGWLFFRPRRKRTSYLS
jgi:hypothetical protein